MHSFVFPVWYFMGWESPWCLKDVWCVVHHLDTIPLHLVMLNSPPRRLMCLFVFGLVFLFLFFYSAKSQSRFYVNCNVISISLKQHLENITLLRVTPVDIKTAILFSISDSQTQSLPQILRAIKNKNKTFDLISFKVMLLFYYLLLCFIFNGKI